MTKRERIQLVIQELVKIGVTPDVATEILLGDIGDFEHPIMAELLVEEFELINGGLEK